MQKLLVSVRGPIESLEAIKGGAKIVDAEYPESALGKVYPLNILAIKNKIAKYKNVKISTNIGEQQLNRKTACQSALGVATAGANIVKVGMARLEKEEIELLTKRVTRTVKRWYPKTKVIPAFFVDRNLIKIFDPFKHVELLAQTAKIDGILIDTFDKHTGKGLLDYVDLKIIKQFVKDCHNHDLEAWIAGSITKTQIQKLWDTGVDVICVRSAACGDTKKRGDAVHAEFVFKLLPK